MIQRFTRDESGMVMALALIMIVLIGVMGAGLLTFASRDLNTVVEDNQGQRAFEMADAGVGVAKRQLTSDCAANTTCIDHYDDTGVVIGTEDIQWSAAKGGVTLNDLDVSPATSDNVSVTIDYRYLTDDFRVLSTGTYGNAKRKIEAIFEGISGVGGGSGIGHPIYYTPSSIMIEGPMTLSGISMFSTRDILMQGLTTPDAFKADYEDSNGVGIFHIPSPKDALKDWDSTKFPAGTSGTWNTVGRLGYPDNRGRKSAFDKPGFAAQGKICGFPSGSPTGICGSSSSIADGVYGYDSTTGPRLAPLDSVTGYPEVCPTSTDPVNPNARGNNLTFCAKDPEDKNPNDAGTIAYPFPRPTPNELRLRGFAQETNKYYKGTSPPWDTLFPNAGTANQVVFIDAENSTLNFATSNSANNKGILVVWCGDLRMNAKFQGIILNLYGDTSTLPGATSCGPEKGIYRNNGQDFSGWLYAEGGTATKAGIELGPNSSVNFLPSGDWSFFNDAFTGGPPTSFSLQGWRELYQ